MTPAMRTCARLFPVLLAGLTNWGLAGEVPAEGLRPYHGEPAAPQRYARPGLLMDAARLAVLLGDGKTPPGASLTVLDARPREEFDAGHLPSARQVDSDALQDPARPPYFLPAPAVFETLAREAGINADTRVVVYDAHGGRLAARVWFVLWAAGHESVSLLDGGFLKWKDEQRPLTREAPPAPSRPGSWRPAGVVRGVCAFVDLAAYLASRQPGRLPPTALLDARSYPEYTGADVRGKLGGHIPGAVNLPWDAMLQPVAAKAPRAETKGFWVWREPAELHAILRATGIRPEQPLAVYDQSGGRAAHLLFTLQLIGYSQVVNYYGGWREYGARDDVEVER